MSIPRSPMESPYLIFYMCSIVTNFLAGHKITLLADLGEKKFKSTNVHVGQDQNFFVYTVYCSEQ